MLKTILDRLKGEPALIIGLAGTVAVAVYDAVQNGSPWTIQALAPVVFAALTRFKVSPA